MPVEAYLRLPEEKPYLEYIAGRVVQKPMPNSVHRRATQAVTFAFGRLQESYGGDAGPEGRVYLSDRGDYVIPDTAYWLPGLPSGDDSIPTVAVEVASPNQSRRDLRQKCRAYLEEGLQIAWLIDPERRTVEVFDAEHDGVVLREGALESPLLPGFRLELATLFA
jgi:Uma2 family endonuclease